MKSSDFSNLSPLSASTNKPTGADRSSAQWAKADEMLPNMADKSVKPRGKKKGDPDEQELPASGELYAALDPSQQTGDQPRSSSQFSTTNSGTPASSSSGQVPSVESNAPASTSGASSSADDDRRALIWAKDESNHGGGGFFDGGGLYGLLGGSLVLGAAAGGGGGGGGSSGSGGGGSTPVGGETTKTIQLKAANGDTLKGAQIEAETIDGRVIKVGTTNDSGQLTFSLSSKEVVTGYKVVGGINPSSSLANLQVMRTITAGDDQTVVINGLTTLVAETFDRANGVMTVDQAESAVKSALRIPNTVSLSTYDPLATNVAGSATALSLLKLESQLQTLLGTKALGLAYFESLAQAIADGAVRSGGLDLSDSNHLASVWSNPTASQRQEMADAASNNQHILAAQSIAGVKEAYLDGLAPSIPFPGGLVRDTGDSATDRITTDPRVVVVGQNTGTKIQYTVDGGVSWQDAVVPPAEGDITVQARLVYLTGGYASAPSDTFTFTYQSPVVPPPLTLQLATDSGLSNVDRVTNVAQVNVGNQSANTFVEYSLDGQRTWQRSFTIGSDGQYDLYARQTVNGASSSEASAPTRLQFTLDTRALPGTAKLAPNVEGQADNDTGYTDSNDQKVVATYSDGVTSNTLPTLAGKAEAGTVSVRVVIAGVSYQVATEDLLPDGSWQLKLTTPLAEGTHVPVVTIVDKAGNTSAPTNMGAFTVDLTSPQEGTINLSATSDTGVSAQDGITTAQRPVLTGTAEPNATVIVSVDDRNYTTKANASGAWTITITNALGEGEYTPTVTIVDGAGNSTEFDGADIIVDLTPPEVSTPAHLLSEEEVDTGADAEDGITSNNLPTIVGTVESGVFVEALLNGRRYAIAAEDGDWSFTVPEGEELDDGTYTVSILYKDDAGNVLREESVPFTIDTEAPSLDELDLVRDEENDTGASQEDGITNNDSPVFRGKVAPNEDDLIEPGLRVVIEIDGSEYEGEVNADGTWEVVADGLADGTYTPIVRVIDLAGNVSEPDESLTLVIDTQAPSDDITAVLSSDSDTGSADDDGITAVSAPVLSGTAEAGAHVVVEVDGQLIETDADDDGNWEVTLPELSDGEYTPLITVTDLAGNVSDPVEGTPFVIDTQAPDEATAELVHDEENDTGEDVTDNITTNRMPTLTGQTEPLAHVLLEVGGLTYETVADEDGNWEIAIDEALEEGEYTPMLVITDLAGNESDPIEGTTFTVVSGADLSIGTVEFVHDEDNDTGESADDGITNNNSPLFRGTGAPGVTVRLDLNGEIFETEVDEEGNWELQASGLSDGEYTPVITMMDGAGNEGEPIEGEESFTIDTQAPDESDISAALTEGAENDTGEIDDDGITSVSGPLLSGTAEPGARVLVDVNGEVTETQASEDGTWEIGLPALADGEYTPLITVIDRAGNETGPVEGTVFVIDTEAPSEATAELVHDEENDTGFDQEDNITNNTSPTLQGETEPLAFVQLEVDGKLYETTADEDGNWEITLSDLSDGEHTPLLTITDLAGNVSDPIEGTPFTVMTADLYDSAEGELVHDEENDTGVSNFDGLTNNASPMLAGTVTAGAYVRVVIDDNVFETEVNPDGTWSLVAEGLSDGEYTPLISVVDIAGNESEAFEGPAFIIDTQAPDDSEITAGLTVDFENDTGEMDDDGITANRAPLLSGTAEPGSRVTVDVNGEIYETEAGDDGSWEIGLAELEDGEYTPLITVTDAAGNESAQVEGTPFVIDTTPPEEATAELLHDEENDTGIDQEDNITNNTSPTLAGTAEPMALVELAIGGQLYEATADEDGNWEITVQDLEAGEYTPILTITDLAGNVSEPIEGTPFTVMTATFLDVPYGELVHDEDNDTGASQTDGLTNNNSPTLSGTAKPGMFVRVDIDGNIYETEVNEDGTWSLTADGLSDGEYTPVITSLDVAGNESDPVEGPSFIVDTSAPDESEISAALTVDADNDTGLADDDGITSNNSPLVSGTAEVGARVLVEIDGVIYETEASDDGTWEIAVSGLSDGEYTPLVTVIDLAGNETGPVEGTTFVIDTEAPGEATAELLHDEENDTGIEIDDNITNNTSPVIRGETEPFAQVLLDLNGLTFEATADEDGNWEIQADGLEPGDYTPVVTITDTAGNTSDPIEGTPFTVMTADALEAPTGGLVHDEENDTGELSDDGLTNNSSPTFAGTATPGMLVKLELDGNFFVTEVGADGTWSLTADGLSDGEYVPVITLMDVAGNESDPFEADPITIDTEAPDEAVITAAIASDSDNDTGYSAEDGITSNVAPLLVGTAEAGARVQVEVDGESYVAEADDEGHWEVQLNTLADGEYTPSITVIDRAGNETGPTDGTTFTIDTDAPSEATVELLHDEVNDTGTDTEDNITRNDSPVLTGETEPFATVLLEIDGSTYETTADVDGLWQIQVNNLSEGEHTPVLTVVDAAGNESEAIEGTPFTVDTTAPDAATGSLVHDEENDTGVSVEDGITSNESPVIAGEAEAGAIVRVSINGQTQETQADDAGAWELSFDDLPDGVHRPVITTIDVAGNATTSFGDAFTVDTTAPPTSGVTGGLLHTAANDTGISATDSVTRVSAPLLQGTASPLALVRVEVDGTEYEATAGPTGIWQVQLESLGDGDYEPLITVVDLAGNVSNQVAGTTFTIITEASGDASGELVHDAVNDTGIDSEDGITANARPTLAGESSPGATVQIQLGTLTFQTAALADGKWSFRVPSALADGTYTPLISVTDLAGNTSDPVEGAPIVIDTRVETATGGLIHDDTSDTGVSRTDSITKNNTPSLSGQAEANATVRVILGTLSFETQADDTGAWTVDVDTELANGRYTPLLEVTDLAGNKRTFTGEPFTVNLAPESLGYSLGEHQVLIARQDISLDLSGGTGVGRFEDYTGNLPAGLLLNPNTGLITGRFTEIPGDGSGETWTWVSSTVQDVAGNESQVFTQLVFTTGEKFLTGTTGRMTINNFDPAKVSTYVGTSGNDTMNIYRSVGDVILTGDGNDTFNMVAPTESMEEFFPMNFARIDGGAGLDLIKIYTKTSEAVDGSGPTVDFSNFNNPDGEGRVLQHVEVVQFASKNMTASISAGDIFRMQSDLFDADGVSHMVRFYTSSRTNGGTVTLDGLKQVGSDLSFTETGNLITRSTPDRYSKFTGVYTDASGDHLVTLLLHEGLVPV